MENERLYRENLNIYRDLVKYKEEADKYLKSLGKALDGLKGHIFSDELLEIDGVYTGYKTGAIEF